MDQYHELSDATMEVMLDSIENVLDEEANANYEVDYSVSRVNAGSVALKLKLVHAERCPDS